MRDPGNEVGVIITLKLNATNGGWRKTSWSILSSTVLSLRSLAVFKQFEGDRKAGKRDKERQSREEPGRATQANRPLFIYF